MLHTSETLLFAVHSPSFFSSIAAGQALVEALLELLVSQAGTALVEKINHSEEQPFEIDASSQNPPSASWVKFCYG